jgi:hypothetical protein
MWKWIDWHVARKSVTDVDVLKEAYLRKNGIEPYSMTNCCFFCDRASPQGSERPMCPNCPGRKVEKKFYCNDNIHSWDNKPRLFYAKLKELNKIRLAKN